MVYFRLAFVLIACLVVWLVIKLLKSHKFDKFCNDLFKGKLKTDTTSKGTMDDISKAETVLSDQSKQNIKKAEKLTTESDGINDFLNKRGVTEKKEGS